MSEPFARPTRSGSATEADVPREPRAFTPTAAAEQAIDIFERSGEADIELVTPPLPARRSLLTLAALWAAGLLISLGLGLAAEALIRDLFARYEWLGWLGLAAFAVVIVGIVALAIREIGAVSRLRSLDRLKARAIEMLASNKPAAAKTVLAELEALYHPRPDMARARRDLATNAEGLLDGPEMLHLAERTLMAPLDARAKTMIAASARRVALVTAVSPRALVDIAFVAYESIRLGGGIAALYGGRPGIFGFFRLSGAVLGHLAVTGGLVLTDGIVEQLMGQGLAARLSARLGEGVVNGLMTVRVGIAAMRVVRPLPFAAINQPMVRDFIPDLAKLGDKNPG